MSEWKPIETAPKDGSWFLAYRGPAKLGTWDRLVIVRWHDYTQDFVWPENGFDIYRDDIDEIDSRGHFVVDPFQAQGSFTHWMDLPVPPEAAA